MYGLKALKIQKGELDRLRAVEAPGHRGRSKLDSNPILIQL